MKKKRALKIILFLLVLIIINSMVLTPIMSVKRYYSTNIEGFFSEEENTIDVMLIGASTMRTNYSPPVAYEKAGFSSYSLAMNSMPIEAVQILIEEVLKTQSPKLFIIDLRAALSQLTNESIRSVIDSIDWSENKINAINKYASDDSPVSFLLPIDKYHTRWKQAEELIKCHILDTKLFYEYGLYKEYDIKSLLIDRVHPSKGYFSLIAKENLIKEADYADITSCEKPQGNSEKALLELMDYLKDKNINALFCISSIFYDKEVIDDKIPQKLNYVKEIVLNNGFECIDFRSDKYDEEIGYDFSVDYLDNRHLNPLGSVKFTEYFADLLDEKYDLPDHRGDEKYDSNWLRAVKAMNNMIDYAKQELL